MLYMSYFWCHNYHIFDVINIMLLDDKNVVTIKDGRWWNGERYDFNDVINYDFYRIMKLPIFINTMLWYYDKTWYY